MKCLHQCGNIQQNNLGYCWQQLQAALEEAQADCPCMSLLWESLGYGRMLGGQGREGGRRTEGRSNWGEDRKVGRGLAAHLMHLVWKPCERMSQHLGGSCEVIAVLSWHGSGDTPLSSLSDPCLSPTSSPALVFC